MKLQKLEIVNPQIIISYMVEYLRITSIRNIENGYDVFFDYKFKDEILN